MNLLLASLTLKLLNKVNFILGEPGFGQYLTDGTAANKVAVPVFETERSLVLPIIDQFNADQALLVTINLQFNGNYLCYIRK